MKKPEWMTGEMLRRLLIVPPVVLGVLVFAVMSANLREPARTPVEEASRVLRVIQAPEVDVVPRVIGHGTAEPGQVWRAVAEVKGRVVHVHPQLKPGAIIEADEELLKIDTTEYELAVAQLEADIESVTAQRSELESRTENYQASLKIEREALSLADQELKRLADLRDQNAVSDAEVDAKQREVLVQRQSVQNLDNSINLLPAQKKSLDASLAVKQTSLKQARIDLEKTTIVAPFTCRLGELSIEIGQFLQAGENLFEGQSTAVTEIDAQVAPHEARNLIDAANAPPLPPVLTTEAVRDVFNLDVTVRLRSGDITAEWDARFSRLREEFDRQTRTLGIVVAVDKPYEQIIPGKRPALVRGMFCEVELRGQPRAGRIVIPRTAIHEGSVYVLDEQKRLRRRAVEVDFAQGNLLCLQSGLAANETLVVSDPTPAIEGMLVDPVVDDKLLASLVAEATGEGVQP